MVEGLHKAFNLPGVVAKAEGRCGAAACHEEERPVVCLGDGIDRPWIVWE